MDLVEGEQQRLAFLRGTGVPAFVVCRWCARRGHQGFGGRQLSIAV